MRPELRRSALSPFEAELLERLERIERLLLARHPAPDERQAQRLAVLAASTQGKHFTSGELQTHARLDTALRAMLDAALVDSPREIGKLLRTLERHVTDGPYRLDRIGTSRDGIVWAVRVSQVSPTAKLAHGMIATIMNDRLSSLTAEQFRHIKSVDAVRWLSCLATHANRDDAATVFAERWPGSPHVTAVRQAVTMATKGNVPGGGPGNWGGPLMPATLGEALLGFAAPFSVYARLGAQRAPFNVVTPGEDVVLSGADWVGNSGGPKPVTSGTLTSVTLSPLTMAAIVVLTRELLRELSPAKEIFVRDRVAYAMARFLDGSLVDPSISAIANVRPASLTNGLTPISSSGTDLTAAVADLHALITAYGDGGGRLETGVFLLSSRNAVTLNLFGSTAFDNLTAAGGFLAGVPALASDAMGSNIVLLDRARVLVADDGDVDFTIARQASLQLLSDPTNHSGTATATSMVSLFQTNSTAIRCARVVNWRALDGAVQFIDDALYGYGTGSPAGSPV